MTRRAFLAWPVVMVTANTVSVQARAGLHVRGTLMDDTSDLQQGYFALCGIDGGPCHAKDAIGISVHPDNAIYMTSLRKKVGHTVQVSIF